MAELVVFFVVIAGLLGLVIGSFLNVVVYRVPAGIPLTRESRCPQCDNKIKPWHNVPVLGWLLLRGRCASCGAPISIRYPLVEAATGIAFAAVAWWGFFVYDGVLGSTLPAYMALPTVDGQVEPASLWALACVVAAYLYFAAISIVLTLIDLDTHRLPNQIVLPSYLVAGGLFAAAAALSADWGALLSATAAMVLLYVIYALLRLARPGGMGGGDVKFAGVIGLYLGWLGWAAVATGAFAAFLYGGVFGIALVVLRRAGRKTAIPFGPWMILGAWTGVFAGDSVGRWYVEMFTAV